MNASLQKLHSGQLVKGQGQRSRSKVKVKGQAHSLYVGEGGRKCFYKHLYFLVGGLANVLLVFKVGHCIFVPRFRESVGTLNLIRLSVRPSVCHKKL